MQQILLTGIEVADFINAIREVVRTELAIQPIVATAPESKEYLNALEAAKLLGVRKQTIFDYRKRNLFPSHKIGGRTLFKRSELLSAVKSTAHE